MKLLEGIRSRRAPLSTLPTTSACCLDTYRDIEVSHFGKMPKGSTQALLRVYEGPMKDLRRLYEGSIKALSNLCEPNTALFF